MKAHAQRWWLFYFFWTLILVALAGCANFAAPRGLDDRLAYAYATHTAVLQAAATSVEMGDLSPDQGEEILELADRSRRLLDAARFALNAGDPRTAEGQLDLALGILTELQAYLRRRR